MYVRTPPLALFRIAALAAGTVVCAGDAAGRDLEPFVLGLNGVARPEHGGFYQALAEGRYEACGLALEIVPGGPGVDHRASLIAGEIDVNVGTHLLGAIQAAEQALPLRVVAAWFQKDPQALIAHPDSGFEEWNDLLGAERYALSDNVFRTYFRWMVADHGFDASRRVAPGADTAELSDPRTVRQGYATSDPFDVERALGRAPNVFLFADNGLDGYAMTSEVMQATLDERPDRIACFVDATAMGWRTYLHGDNAEANALIRGANPRIDDERIRFAVENLKARGIVDGGDASVDGAGAMRAERIREFHDAMVDAGVVSGELDIDRVYTLDFVNHGVGVDAGQ